MKTSPSSIVISQSFDDICEMNEKITRVLRGEEGEILHVYPDHLGFATLGVGRLVDERKGGGISLVESAYLLANDIESKTEEVTRRIPWMKSLDPVRQSVLILMSFQMGTDGVLGFVNTLKMIRAGDYNGAARGMLNSLWARQTPDRAYRLSEQMRLGEFQYKEGF